MDINDAFREHLEHWNLIHVYERCKEMFLKGHHLFHIKEEERLDLINMLGLSPRESSLFQSVLDLLKTNDYVTSKHNILIANFMQ